MLKYYRIELLSNIELVGILLTFWKSKGIYVGKEKGETKGRKEENKDIQRKLQEFVISIIIMYKSDFREWI